MFLTKKITFIIFTILLAALTAFLVAKFSVFFLAVILGFIVILPVFSSSVWGIYLLLASLVAGQLIRLPLPVGEGGILLSDILTGLVLVAWIVKKLVLKEKFGRPFLFFPILGFAGVALISLAINSINLTFDEILSSSFYLIRWIEYAGIYFVINDLASGSPVLLPRKKVVKGLLFTGLAVIVLGFLQLRFFSDFSPMVKYGWDPHQGRLLSTWFDPNFVGGFIVILLILLISIVSFYPKKNSENKLQKTDFNVWLLIILSLVFFLSLILTYSRSAYLAFLAGFLVIILTPPLLANGGKGRLVNLLITGFVTLIVLVSLVTIFPRAQERIQGARDLDVTAKARLESWKKTWSAIGDNYIIGIGYNTMRYTQSISISKIHSASGSDSSLLTIWLTTGIIGLFFYLWIYLKLIKKSFLVFWQKNNSPLRRAIGLGILGIIFAILLNAMFVNSLLYPHIMLTLWILAGLL